MGFNLYSVSHHSWACTLLFIVANLIYSDHVLYTFTLYYCVIVLFCIPFRLTPQKSGMNIQSNCVAKMHQLHPSQLSAAAWYQMQLKSRAIKPPPQMTPDQIINFIPITNFLPSIQMILTIDISSASLVWIALHNLYAVLNINARTG